MRLEGSRTLVTGGGSGIGEAICRAFAVEGARVAVVDVREEPARRVAGELDGAIGIVADVSDSAAVDRAVGEAVATFGGLDVLVNNAGIRGGAETDRAMELIERQLLEAATGTITTTLGVTEGLTDAQWRLMISTHLDGCFHGTRAALRVMVPQGSGCIINMASICGMMGCTGSPHYSAAKGGILAFTRAVAKEVMAQGIRVNALAPGYIDTPMAESLSPLVRGALSLQTPIGRLGRSEEIAAAAVFLASADASFLCGETLSPNGGYLTV